MEPRNSSEDAPNSAAMLAPNLLERGLRALGYADFRPGQREAIETLLSERKVLLVAPTGGGKSLVYQLPATLLPGTTLVVSPLIALMHDQVAALSDKGVAATYLASTLGRDELNARLRRLAQGQFRIAYVAPERLADAFFRRTLRELNCPLVAIDEAHCISEWGHDFRPEYLQLDGLLSELPEARVLACTATATPVVRDEILLRLGLPPETPQLVRGFARPNLALAAREVKSRHERDHAVDRELENALGSPKEGKKTAIVYSPTRRLTEEEAERLKQRGWKARAYHAGLSPAERQSTQTAFAAGELQIVVATNAFGMGIDRADVRAVIHLGPPGSVEAYYQEVGRAGRDGEPATGLMLHSPKDLPLRRQLIEMPTDDRVPEPTVVEHKWQLFLELMRWAEGGSCRHDAILRYFGDEAESLGGCGICDVCRNLEGDEAFDPETRTLIVRKALSGIARVHGKLGIRAASKLLRGESDPRLERNGLDRVATFGALAEHSEEWITRLLQRCVTAGWATFTGGDRPVLVLTRHGNAVMRAEAPARILLPSIADPATDLPRSRRERRPRSSRVDPSVELDAPGIALFEELRTHRAKLAKEQKVPAYVVASDRSLREMAANKPICLDDLLNVYGFGPAKISRYGAGFVELVRKSAK
jgi:ATP-dependent DNA helicase RecQ